MIHRRERMSQKGLKHWSPKLRPKVHKYVYINLGVRHAPYYIFENRMLMAQWITENYGYGHFYMFIWRKGYYKKRSVKRLRPYFIAEIEIEENKPPIFKDLKRISKFSWFEPKKKSIS